MVDVLVEGIVLLGATIGSAGATLIPYIQKFREGQVIDGSELKFDKKFLVTAGISLLFGFIIATLAFDEAIANVNDGDSIFKVFISAFVFALTVNLAVNKFISPNKSLVTLVKEKDAEIASLKGESDVGSPVK